MTKTLQRLLRRKFKDSKDGAMNPRWKLVWIDLLLSKHFHQARKALRVLTLTPHGPQVSHCCLGVIAEALPRSVCRFAGREGLRDLYFEGQTAEVVLQTDSDSSEAILPEGVRQYIGLREDIQDHLTRLNDAGATFTQIAHWIDKNL